jgi:hypothetical protein
MAITASTTVAARTGTAPATAAPTGTAPTGNASFETRRMAADGMAVASFVLGLVGLLLFNIVFGPCAVVLGALATARGTRRRGRALLGLALGIADLAILTALVTIDHSVFWNFGS